MHSHYSFDYVMKLSLRNITRLLKKAFDKRKEQKAWQLYLMKYQNMTSEDYMSFEDFYNPREQSNKSEKEILTDVKEILSAFKKEGEIDGNI